MLKSNEEQFYKILQVGNFAITTFFCYLIYFKVFRFIHSNPLTPQADDLM